jgi:predicted small lipoprotein YifL
MNTRISAATVLALASTLAACGGSTPPAEEPQAAVAEERADKAEGATEANTDRAEKAADKAEDSAASSDKSADKAEKSADDSKK